MMAKDGRYVSGKEKQNRRLPTIPVPVWIFVPAMVVYSELLLHLWTNDQLVAGRMAAVAAFAVGFGCLLALVSSLFPPKVGKWVGFGLAFAWAVLCIVEYFIHDAFKNFMDFGTILAGAGGVAGNYLETVLNLIVSGLGRIFLLLLPLVLYAVFTRPVRCGWKGRAILAAETALVYLAAFGVVCIVGLDTAKLSDEFSFDSGIRSFGLSMGFLLNETTAPSEGSDLEFEIAATQPSTAGDEEAMDPTEETEPPVVYTEQVYDLDFAALAESEANFNIASLHSYVAGQTPSMTNEYTGLFQGKNLILITAEAFSGAYISQELTPTLYRLMTQGIYFTDYYQPVWGAGTTGGEYSNVVGLVPSNGSCMKEATQQDLFLTMGNQLQALGYSSAAFHNNDYTYYDRHKTHTYLGYDYFMGYGNGMEKGIPVSNPCSDLEMMEYTVPLYIDQQPFSVYYMTVSGHAAYTQKNAMSAKNYDKVADLDYSEAVKCYIATQLELEAALTSLLEQLEAAGILNDTVIVVSSDHYPYGLASSNTWNAEQNYLTELFGEACNSEFVRDQNTLIIWSGCIEGMDIVVDTPTYSLDILPTLSNLFGLEYDSRLMVGRDVFSDQEPLVLWTSYSWKTDKGTYYATTGEFTPNEGVEVSDDYVESISAIVRNRIKYSKAVASYNYFNYVSAALAALDTPTETE